jgi:hypothetical protein
MFGWLGNMLRGSAEAGVVKALPEHEFHSAVAGVSHKNADGSSRQRIIRESVRPGYRLGFRLEDDNPVDPDAVAVFAPNGRQIGYLRAHNGLPEEVREWIAKGSHIRLTVTEVTGGIQDKPTCGVNILVQIYEPIQDLAKSFSTR